MPTPIENLKSGDYICVTGAKVTVPIEILTSYSGKPYRVLAISLPFIALDDKGEICALDIRLWEVQKVTTKYVKAMLGIIKEKFVVVEDQPVIENKNACPRCGAPMVQKLVKLTFELNEWHLVCRECGNDSGKPSGVK